MANLRRSFITRAEAGVVLDLPHHAIGRVIRDQTLLTLPTFGQKTRVAVGPLRELVSPERRSILDALVDGRLKIARPYPQARRDPTGDWIVDRCSPADDSLLLQALTDDHLKWCADRGVEASPARVVSQRLTLAGYRMESFSRVERCHGIRLTNLNPKLERTLLAREVRAIEPAPESSQAVTAATDADDLRARLDPAKHVVLELLLQGVLAVPADLPSDGVEQFLNDCCIPGDETPSGRLYRAYRQWGAQQDNVRALDQTSSRCGSTTSGSRASEPAANPESTPRATAQDYKYCLRGAIRLRNPCVFCALYCPSRRCGSTYSWPSITIERVART